MIGINMNKSTEILLIFSLILFGLNYYIIIVLTDNFHSEVGDYPDFISANCGLHFVPKICPVNYKTKCFKTQMTDTEIVETELDLWYQNNVIPRKECSKVLCGYEYNDVRIFAGNPDKYMARRYYAQFFIKHSKFDPDAYRFCEFDIALVKVDEDIEFTIDDNQYLVNSICLPKKDKVNDDYEVAVFFGCGKTSNDTELPLHLNYPDNQRKEWFLLSPFNQCYKCYCYYPSIFEGFNSLICQVIQFFK